MSERLPDRLGDSALPEIIRAARVPVLAAIAVGAVAFYGPAVVTIAGPGGSSGSIAESAENWDFNYLDTVYGMIVRDTQEFTAADTNSTGWSHFAGDIDGPGPGGNANVITIETGTTPTGDDTFARVPLEDVEDMWAPRYFQYSTTTADTIHGIGCIMRWSFPSATTTANSFVKGLSMGGSSGDVWWGWSPPGTPTRSAGQDTLIVAPTFSLNGVAAGYSLGFVDLYKHLSYSQASDTLVASTTGNTAGVPGPWYKIEALLIETNGKVAAVFKDVLILDSDSASADWYDSGEDTIVSAPTSFNNRSQWKVAMTTLGGSSGISVLGANDFYDVDRCVVYGLGG